MTPDGTTPTHATPAGPRTVRRLRPGVAVTLLRNGLHLRGRRGNVTLEGGTGLPTLWRRLEGPLSDGGLEELLDGLEPGSSLRAAVDTLLGQLDAHDLLVAGPAGPAGGPTGSGEAPDHARPPASGPAARWIGVTAAQPAAAAASLAAVRAEVVAADPGAPLAGAAGRALERGGVPVTYTADPALPEGRVLLYAHGGAGAGRGIVAGLRGGTGYVTAPGGPDQLRSDAAALEERLAPAPEPTGSAGPPEPAPPGAFVPLLAGAAAHRLLCTAAGLPDPADEGDDGRLLPGLPAVLLADARPLRADYRTWLGPGRLDTDRRADLAPAATLGEALRRVAALGDARCGALPEPLPGELRQLPVPLATCELPAAHPGGRLTGGAPRLDLARLEVFCRTAELLLDAPGSTVGADPGHARGRALREAAARRPGPRAGQPPVAADHWSGHPQLRHWWTTLTVRLAVPARLEVYRAAPGEEAYHALVHRTAPGADGGGPPEPSPLGEAVEATPGDAAAFAALAAVAAVCAPGPAAGPVRPSGGAVAPLASAGARTAAWEDHGWTGRWLADTAGREEALQAALGRLTGAALPAGPPAPPGNRELADRLRAFGFTVLHTPEETR
ncbi:hypothetical protein [Streptomyces sp. NPDC051567]|uniref:hypothetical protein n=1 Tax=Streptomyces sp. NPDC051567 TaxID=3365660 RepID=UPI0037932694